MIVFGSEAIKDQIQNQNIILGTMKLWKRICILQTTISDELALDQSAKIPNMSHYDEVELRSSKRTKQASLCMIDFLLLLIETNLSIKY